MLKAPLAAAVALTLAATAAAAQPGSRADPIPLRMKRGTDRLVLHGVLRPRADCCAYTFRASSGQKLYWRETGAAVRMGIVQPDGEVIDPGLPNPADLPQTGRYKLLVAPDLMAEGAFGPFKLRLRIPPRR